MEKRDKNSSQFDDLDNQFCDLDAVLDGILADQEKGKDGGSTGTGEDEPGIPGEIFLDREELCDADGNSADSVPDLDDLAAALDAALENGEFGEFGGGEKNRIKVKRMLI